MYNFYIQFNDFFDQGGPVLFVILLASILLWSLIIERYWFFLVGYKKIHKQTIKQWNNRTNKNSWHSQKVREGLLADVQISAKHNLIPINTLIAVLPLLGLLGTVTGMITIFDVINVFGTSNARGMADGISRALLPTTAGLVTSIVALYFSTDLSHRAQNQLDKTRDLLTH